MKILVRGTNWVGDAVMTIPALRQLRRIFPDAEMTLHTRAWAEGIFRDADIFDEILTFDKTKSKIKDALTQSKELRNRNFELAVLFPNSFETALVAKMAKIPRRFGYAKEGRSFLLTDPIEMPAWKNERHEVFYYLNLIAAIEAEYFARAADLETAPHIDLKVSAERRAQARKILEENGVELSKKTIALGVGSTNSRAKRWPAENYARLNDLLQNELNVNVLLVGAKDEAPISDEVLQNPKKNR